MLASIIIGTLLLAILLTLIEIAGRILRLHRTLLGLATVTGGEHDGRVDMLDRINRILIEAEAGRIPALRKDDWIPKFSDRDRTKGLRQRRSQEDEHLDPYEGGELWR